MNKKVIFLNLWDAISIPSKAERPKDVTDFQVNYNLVEALRSMSDTFRINLLGCAEKTNNYDLGFNEIHSVVAYAISTYTDKAVVCYYSHGEGLKETLREATNDTLRVGLLSDKKDWLIIGNKSLANKTGIDYIDLEELCNGGAKENNKGTEG